MKTSLPVVGFTLCVALPLSPLWAEDPAASVQDVAAKAIAEQAGGPAKVRGLQFSRAARGANSQTICATTEAYNSSGHFIGLTYLSVTLSADGQKVTEIRDMTGLLSDCYGAQFAPYRSGS